MITTKKSKANEQIEGKQHMDQIKKQNLESHGWKFCDASDFLQLSEDKLFLDITSIPIESPTKKEHNPIDKICEDRGWDALGINEEMTVSFNRKKYKILRTN